MIILYMHACGCHERMYACVISGLITFVPGCYCCSLGKKTLLTLKETNQETTAVETEEVSAVSCKL